MLQRQFYHLSDSLKFLLQPTDVLVCSRGSFYLRDLNWLCLHGKVGALGHLDDPVGLSRNDYERQEPAHQRDIGDDDLVSLDDGPVEKTLLEQSLDSLAEPDTLSLRYL